MPDGAGLQAAVLRDCLAGAGARHRAAELLGIDRLGGAAQLGLGIGGLFVSGLAAVSFLVAGAGVGAAARAWDDSPAGQDGALARAARAVAAASVSVPAVVILDDADWLDQDLAVTLVENLVARHSSQVLVVAAVDPHSGLAAALTSRARYGLTEGLVHTAEADPDMGHQARTDLARKLCPHLPGAAIRRIAERTTTFAEVFAVAAAPRMGEVSPAGDGAGMLAAVDAVINARLRREAPSMAAVVLAWARGPVHARQAGRALEVLGAGWAGSNRDVLRWESLARLADPASPRLAEQVAALPAQVRQAMAAAVLDEALRIAAEPGAGLVDRVVAAHAAHRVRHELAGRGQLPRAHCELAAGLEALGDRAAALEIATQALAGWPPDGQGQDERESLMAAALRLGRMCPGPGPEPLVQELIAEAVAGGATVGLEARIWAVAGLLDLPGRRETALALIDQITADLDKRHGLGAAGDRWRLLLAFHAGRAGYPAMTQQLLAPMLSSSDPGQHDAARAVLYSVTGPGADTRLQVCILEAELRALPPDADDDRLRLHHVLAAGYTILGDYRQALAHGRRELVLRNSIHPPGHPSTLLTRHSVAYWTGQCGDNTEALRLYQELLPDLERVLGPGHTYTLSTRNGIANCIGDCGRSAKALRLCRDLLPDVERFLGPAHPDTLITRGGIAFWTYQRGNAAEALRLYRELLPDQERVHGHDHTITLATRANIAGCTAQCGHAAEALRLYRELLADRERILGPGHPDTLATRADIAASIGEGGNAAEALRLYQELLPDQERALGPGHPSTLITREIITLLTSQRH